MPYRTSTSHYGTKNSKNSIRKISPITLNSNGLPTYLHTYVRTYDEPLSWMYITLSTYRNIIAILTQHEVVKKINNTLTQYLVRHKYIND